MQKESIVEGYNLQGVKNLTQAFIECQASNTVFEGDKKLSSKARCALRSLMNFVGSSQRQKDQFEAEHFFEGFDGLVKLLDSQLKLKTKICFKEEVCMLF